jgi:hypothetical protein
VEFPPSLQQLSVAKTTLHGRGLAPLCKLKNFRELDAADSSLDDDGIETICSIGGLGRLDLSRCTGISDTGFRRLATMSSLNELNLCGTHVSDAMLKEIATSPKLRTLTLILSEAPTTAATVRQLSSPGRGISFRIDERTNPRRVVVEISRVVRSDRN